MEDKREADHLPENGLCKDGGGRAPLLMYQNCQTQLDSHVWRSPVA